MPPEHRQLLVDVAAAEFVRVQIGPIGWVVLEAMASQAPPSRGVTEVACSARSLAKVVGVSKDTVARSLSALIVLGIVERVHHRDELSGRFSSTTYRVDLALVGIAVVVARHDPLPSNARPHEPSSALTDDHQLSLLR
jgi:DNA-binding IclR family transcriptional regulator